MSVGASHADLNQDQPAELAPDADALRIFVDTMFRYADGTGYLALRGFRDDVDDEHPVINDSIRLNERDLHRVIFERARQAATFPKPVVFCPPVATFNAFRKANMSSLHEGVGISAECDQKPSEALRTLTAIIGKPTIVVASGGQWVNAETGEIEDKLHLHWRLAVPTRTPEDHARLRYARAVATALAEGDNTNKAIVHPIRWPGSWHRKAEPRLARIVEINDDIDIELEDAIGALEEAAERASVKVEGHGGSGPSDNRTGEISKVGGALSVIPNGDDVDWDRWNTIGMAIFGATNGSDDGLRAFMTWSQRSPKFDEERTAARWKHYHKSPPHTLGIQTLIYNANKTGQPWQHLFKESAGVAPDFETTPATSISLDDFVAHMPTHTYIFIPSRESWPAASVNARIAPLPGGKDGKKIQASAWLDANHPVDQMTWAPGLPLKIDGKLIAEGGWIDRPGCAVFNLYRAPIIKPRKGDARLWLNHVDKLFGASAGHIVNWLAHRVQRPDEKINHAIVLGGDQGIGKDTLLEPVKSAVGPWNFLEVSPKNLLGRFNGHLKSVILRVSEARDLGDVDRFAFYDHTKALTAAPPDVLRVDEKHRHEYAIPNVCGVIITTNHKADGIYLPADDRRHFVAWSDCTRAEFSEEYWNGLYAYFAAGGTAIVAEYLATLDLTTFNSKAPPPKTAAFWEIVNASRAPEDAELADILDRLDRPAAVTLSMIAGAASLHPEFGEWLRDRKNARKIPHRMESCDYTPVRNPDAQDGHWKIEGRRQAVYALKNMSERDRIAAATALGRR